MTFCPIRKRRVAPGAFPGSHASACGNLATLPRDRKAHPCSGDGTLYVHLLVRGFGVKISHDYATLTIDVGAGRLVFGPIA